MILIMLMVTQVCKCVKTHVTVYSKLVQFILCKLHLSKVVLRNKTYKTKKLIYVDLWSCGPPWKYVDTSSLKHQDKICEFVENFSSLSTKVSAACSSTRA